jgi:hypothetical protein
MQARWCFSPGRRSRAGAGRHRVKDPGACKEPSWTPSATVLKSTSVSEVLGRLRRSWTSSFSALSIFSTRMSGNRASPWSASYGVPPWRKAASRSCRKYSHPARQLSRLKAGLSCGKVSIPAAMSLSLVPPGASDSSQVTDESPAYPPYRHR